MEKKELPEIINGVSIHEIPLTTWEKIRENFFEYGWALFLMAVIIIIMIISFCIIVK